MCINDKILKAVFSTTSAKRVAVSMIEVEKCIRYKDDFLLRSLLLDVKMEEMERGNFSGLGKKFEIVWFWKFKFFGIIFDNLKVSFLSRKGGNFF